MRYLNKIIFINSASVQYAEVELDGNVHLIGDQGAGKTTLLRAILFFYNANKIKLGIPKEKKSFDEYYFSYQNSYIIYEVMRDSFPFCVLAYKVNGKTAYRFINAAYKKELFLNQENRALESWDKIRSALGRTIHYTSLITSYQEFRKILYGDHKTLKPEFRKYALIESRQFQNIPRTIQNVLLNSNLESTFIKKTIIKSLNEEEFLIDIENYAKNHLRDFQTRINDIKIWFKKNRKGYIVVRKQAEKVIDTYQVLNFLNREKKELVQQLASRMVYVENEKPVVTSNLTREIEVLKIISDKRERLKNTHKKREQDLVSEIKYISKELTKAKDKKKEYDNQGIEETIQKVAQKNSLTNEQKALDSEKNLLTSKFAGINQKYQALITQIENQQQQFENNNKAEINSINSRFSENKTSVFSRYEKIINQIRKDNQTEKDHANSELKTIFEQENYIKNKKSELKHKRFYVKEIEANLQDKVRLEKIISIAKSTKKDAENQIQTNRKEWDLEVKEVERNHKTLADKELEKKQRFSAKIQQIEHKINQSKSSLHGWLNDNYPDWKQTIGKVIDEEHVLFNTELSPKLVSDKIKTFFGVELNLSALKSRIKTVAEYREEIEEIKLQIKASLRQIHQLNAEKDTELQKLKIKFNKKINNAREFISESNYKIIQKEQKLKKNKITFDELTNKAQREKESQLKELEKQLQELAYKKSKAQENLETIQKSISRKITLKKNEREKEIKVLEKVKNDKITALNIAITQNKASSKNRVGELREKLETELGTEGADIERLKFIDNRLEEIQIDLDYIKNNERVVIEYEKDKRELFDNVPQWKSNKISLEKKKETMLNEHKTELDKINNRYSQQDNIVKAMQLKLEEFENDIKAFESFKKSEAFTHLDYDSSIELEEEEILKTAINIISEINDKYLASINKFKEFQQATNAFTGNFNEQNIFSFKTKLNTDEDYLKFADNLKEFIAENKIKEYETRVNERFASIIRLIGRETTELNSKEAEIEKIIKKINDDFATKNFVKAIKEMEIRTRESSNSIVKILIKIKEFNDENNFELGEANLFTSEDINFKNQKAIDLLKKLIEEIEKTKSTTLTLSESFDLQFRIVENDNDSGWVEKLANVGSEGTDVLVKAMLNILLLNVFKNHASRKFKDFKLHCMMDEIGKLHPTNVKGILRFANERNILLINGSPTSQNATDYKYTYKLAKVRLPKGKNKHITKINRLVKVNIKSA